jgi:hypothetical protein
MNKIYYMRFRDNGSGRGAGDADDAGWPRYLAEDPANGYLQIDFETYRRVAGSPHHFRLDLEQGVVPKAEVALIADKPVFLGNSKDECTLTWSIGRPVNLQINGHPIENNPHTDAMILTWDQEARLRITIDDADLEFFGTLEIVAR